MSVHLTQRSSAETSLGHDIVSVEVEHYQVPLEEVLVDAGHGDHHHFELILCRLRTADGIEGTGYTYTGGRGGTAIAALLRDAIAPSITGADSAQIESIWTRLQNEFHYVGRGGILSFAISAVDIALWDIRCKRANLPLADYLGKVRTHVPCYAGFIDLTFSDDRQARHVEKHVERGFVAFKTKVGAADMARDIYRVTQMREQLGNDRELMIDANWSYSVDRAIEFSKAVAHLDITWFEEPICPDNIEGYATIAEATDIPLAMGENLHLVAEFERAARYASLSFLQPDASNIGGITGWLRVAEIARAKGLRVCSHGMHELHVSLLAAQSHGDQLEVHAFPIDQYTKQPLRMENGTACVPETVGTGVSFERQRLRPHLVI